MYKRRFKIPADYILIINSGFFRIRVRRGRMFLDIVGRILITTLIRDYFPTPYTSLVQIDFVKELYSFLIIEILFF